MPHDVTSSSTTASATSIAPVVPFQPGRPGVTEARYDHNLHYGSPEAVFRARYQAIVRSLAVIGGDREEAADAVQEAFIKLCLEWPKISSYEDPAAWVRRVALNRLQNRRRSLLRQAAALVRSRPRESATATALAPVSPLEIDPVLVAAVRRLPDRQRTAVALRYVEDLPITEIARSMGISPGAVDRHLNRARAALRAALGPTRPGES